MTDLAFKIRTAYLVLQKRRDGRWDVLKNRVGDCATGLDSISKDRLVKQVAKAARMSKDACVVEIGEIK